MDVTPKTEMRPAGRGGPPLSLPFLETKQSEPGALHPGGKILPFLRLHGTTTEPTLDVSVGPPQNVSSALPADRRSDLPIHNALTSTALGDALDGEKSDPKEIVRGLHVNRGHAASQQLKRTMAEADGKANRLTPLVDDVVRECEICRAFDVAPTTPASGTSSASSSNEKAQVDLLFLDDLIVLHVLDIFSRHSLLVPVRSKSPERVWDSFCALRIAVFGKPRIIQMGEGGEWEND